MKNTNISCIGLDSVASYFCKGMKLRCYKWRSILSKLRHWPPGTNNLPFVPSFFACGPVRPDSSRLWPRGNSRRHDRDECANLFGLALLLIHIRIRFGTEFFDILGVVRIDSQSNTRTHWQAN
jgi:hypothetical protein